MKNVLKGTSVFGFFLIFMGCATIPQGATPVAGFEKEKYLGKWYEIARYDFTFEKDLNNTSAEYSILPNGFIGVVNKGYKSITKEWTQANGKGRFKGQDNIGALEISFFGPFFAAYNVIAVDPEYQYALVAGKNTKYLWILSRTKDLPVSIREEYIGIAQKLGYDLEQLIWVEHDK